MKVEPRRYLYGFKTHSGAIHWQLNTAPYNGQREPDYVEHLTTVADVLAALRQPSVAMIHAANPNDDLDVTWKKMLDAFEREQQPWRTLPR